MPRPFNACDYTELDEENYMYLNDDYPIKAYETDEISFVAQPLGPAKLNKKHNVVPVPLMMTDEWELLKEDYDFVRRLREIPKKYDYIFIGQCHYMGREVFRTLNLPKYVFEDNPKGIFHLEPQEKKKELVKFLEKIAEAKFVFAPRGMGSSSFRLYQALMVGSVPIATSMQDYPFVDRVDWDSFCLRGDLPELPSLIAKSQTIDFDEYSKKGQEFWDKYCRHDRLYEELRKYV